MAGYDPPQPVSARVRERVRNSARPDSRGDYYQLTFQAMSTRCRVNFRAASSTLARDVQNQVLEWTADFEARYSRFIPESIVGQVNAASGGSWVEVDEATDRLLNLCQEMVNLTRGAFDPATLPMIRLWNWKASPPEVPSGAALAAARELSGWDKVQRRPGAVCLPKAGMGIDLGGIGKEYAVDHVMQMTRQAGLLDVLVDFGQDVRAYGQSPGKGAWFVGLEDPKQPGQCWNGVAVTNHAVATSGDYYRSFTVNGRRYGHILDPRTGQPVDNGCLAVTVIAESCTLAGVLSTSAFVLGASAGIDLVQLCPGPEACIITTTARHQTRNFSAYVVN